MVIGRPFVAAAMVMLSLVAGMGHALAQQAKAPPKAAPKAAPNTEQKGSPTTAGQPPQQPSNQGQQPKMTFSPWTKVCPKGPETNSKKMCFTGKDGRVESGVPVVAAVVIEPEGEPKKLLRITLPLGMALQPGTRLVVDQGQPITAPYVVCIANGCMADYEASQELINNMKKGSGLILQAINGGGQPVSITLPLADFAKAHDGAPMEQKEFEELQRKLSQQPQVRPSFN